MNSATNPTKQCPSCRTERLVSTFERDLLTPDHLSTVCMPCAELPLQAQLDQAYQRGVDRATEVIRSHQRGRKAEGRATRTERALQRYQEAGGKRCVDCWHVKPLTLAGWHRNATKVDGFQTTCRQCIGLKSKLQRKVWLIARDALRAAAGAAQDTRAAATVEPVHLAQGFYQSTRDADQGAAG